MRRELTAAIATLSVVTTAVAARAGPLACGVPGRPWVEIVGSAPDLPAVTGLLRVELTGRGIDLCPPSEGRDEPPIAAVSVDVSEQAARIVVEVRDRLTAKRVDREVDLGAVPRDGRPLTLAVAAAELLRASWAELALVGAPRTADEVPPAVEEAISRDLATPRRSSPSAGIGVSGALEHFGSGATLYGADVRGAAGFGPRFAAVFRLGLRAAPTAGAPDGEVHSSAWLAGAGAAVRITPWRTGGVDAVARFDVERVSYVAVPAPQARGAAETGTALLAGAGAQGWIEVGPSLRLVLDASLELPFQPVRAQDAGRDVTSVSGIGVAGGLGLGVVL
ncbi:MAG TPA: hypothetical protein VKU41_23745 [Polyangiaceae bacterium]|nr:hypothetical protein [Polyangiaceae bacterium]